MSNQNQIPAVEKTIQIMEYISAHPGRVSQSELIKNLNIPQATCYRIIATLVANKWLDKNSKNRYDIAPQMATMAKKINFQLERYRLLQPVLDALATKVGFSAKLSICKDEEQINVLSAKAPWDISITATVGTKSKIENGGSAGAIFLAHLPSKCRKSCEAKMLEMIKFYQQNNYSIYHATDNMVKAWQVDAISVPILDEEKTILGVITLLTMPQGFENCDIEQLVFEMNKITKLCINTLE